MLVYPQISFTLHSNGTELFNLRACSYRQRIVEVFGKRLNQDLLPIDVDTSLCHIHGFVGKPESARKKAPHQYFFVNDRYMKHPYFHKAVITLSTDLSHKESRFLTFFISMYQQRISM